MSTALLGRVPAGRRAKDRIATVVLGAMIAVILAGVLWIIGYVAVQGIRAISPAFLVRTPPGSPAAPGGGFANGIIGTIEIVGLAFLIAAPIGILSAVALSELGTGRLSGPTRFATDILTGMPTIVIGAFVYAVWVVRFGFSGLAGAIALAIVMLPLVVRSSEEALRLVPSELREASLALGATRSRTILTVTLPAASSGITTGLVLAVARAAGETAPLLLTALGNDIFFELNPAHRMSTLSLQIFSNAISGFAAAQARAWAGAFTLIALVLVLAIGGRLLARRNRPAT